MSILAVSAGVVTAVRGEAFIRSPEGDLIPVKVGDSLQAGQVILGANGEVIETAPGDRAAAAAAEVDQAINNLDEPASEENAPAAGLTIGGSTSLGEGLRVERVSETVSPASFDAATDTAPTPTAPVPGALTDQRPLGASDPAEQPQLPYLLVRGVDAVEEGQPVEFIVSLTQPSVDPVSVQLNLLAGSDPVDAAQPGVDTATALQYFNALTQQWAAVTGDLTFATGQTEIRVRVATVDDADVEGLEYLRLQATVTQGSVANDKPAPAGEAPIIDNDKPYLVVVGERTTEGEHAHYTVELTQASPEDVVVSLTLLAGSDPVDAAQPGVDTTGPLEYFNVQSGQWQAVTGDLTLSAGETQLQVRVATVDDAEVEGLEYLRLQATVKQGSVANDNPALPPAGEAPIIDNDKPYLVVLSEPATEGAHAHYTVELTQASPEDVVVSLALLSGSDPVDAAQPGVDTIGPLEYFNAQTQQWVTVTGDLTLPAGQTQLQVRVATVDDAEVEGVEYLRLQATVKQGSVANDDPAAPPANDVAIIDNDKPYLVVHSVDVIEGQHAHYAVQLTSAAAEVVSVQLAVLAGGTPADQAAPGFDSAPNLEVFNTVTGQWDAVTGPLTFQPGETQFEIRVATLDDQAIEPVEYLRLQATVVEGSVANVEPLTWNDLAITDNEGRTITGTAGADEALGQAGDDVLTTHGGDDLLAGGQGNDRLNGGEGADVFAWHLSDVVSGITSVDRIEAFDVAPHAAGGDVLDLRDLLQGENTEGGAGNLAQYLHFDTSGSDTRIQISLQGDLNNGAGTINQEIVLEGVNLRTGLGLDAGAADGMVISRMLADQKLWVDAA